MENAKILIVDDDLDLTKALNTTTLLRFVRCR